MRRIGFILVTCLFPFLGFGQDTQEWQRLKEKYPGEPAVYMERSETLSIAVKGDSLSVYSDIFEDILYLKEQSEVFANRRVHGSHFTEVEDLKAKTLIWDRSRHKELSVSNFAKKFDTDDGVFYDDSYYYSVSFPAVAPRNRTQLQYRNAYKDARFIPGFIFASYMPQEKSVYTIKTTGDIELMYDVLNDKKKQVKFRRYSKGKDVFYEWSVSNMESLKLDANSPSIRYFAPHVIVSVKSYTTPSGKKTVLSSLDDLHDWYFSFVKDLKKAEPSKDLINVVNRLKEPGDTEKDVVRKIFYWVQDNIRYIAFEDGMRGLIPHNGSYVCDKRYGDCKDMASLIVNMLELAGIKGYYTWIGTRDIPYRYSEFPSPMVDNHMIATYISPDHTYYYLDATSNHTPFGLPSSMIQGKEALISKGPSDYEVKVVPVIPKERNTIVDSVFLAINNDELEGKGTVTLDGYAKVFAGYKLDRAQKDATEEYVAQLVGKGSNKFYLDEFSLSNLDNRDKPTRVNYAFRIGDYFQRIGNEIYVNLNLNKDRYNDYINSKIRETPWENEYQYIKEEVSVFEIPKGYRVDYLPPDVIHNGANLGIDVRYESDGKAITMHKKFYINFLLLQPDQFSRWNESVKQLSEAYKESIILKKI
jgi:transglutaminase-like putative cysteine protease